ncbi:dnaJ homolog subfamily B member 8 isoform X2 [Brassica rapa]|uniref:dnaJ homolog subfamily B member 8 isoform X2 n=1 Tax=Brassica campestris TaxID=3711 RepID=UPI0004F1BC02|nr:dnaJ homolog subfamily B member 8 isoform X2 [Brassica rapa]
MDGGGSNVRSSYYNVLGIRKDASVSDVRAAYRKLAMKWHPDRYARTPDVAGEAKRRFQQIQEAYSVLNDENKRSMYDAGLYDPHEDDDDGDSLEDLQRMFTDIVGGDSVSFACNDNSRNSKRPRVNISRSSAAMR